MAGFVALWLCGFVASSCGDTQSEYSSCTCYFVFDDDAHLDPTLAAAMTRYSGVFTESIFNAIDTRRTLIMGMNDGVIVGYGVLSDPVTFYAYDRECPNCFDPNRIPIRSYALTTTSNGMAVCNTCKRKYDMNNGGNLVEGDAGKKLTRYRAATTGPYGKLSVN